jgi:hypothetical protein
LLYIHMQLTKMQFTSFQITNHIKCVVPTTNYSQWKKTLQFQPNLARERRGGAAVASLVTNSLERPSPFAVQNEFPNQSMLFAEPPLNVVAKQPSHAQKLKSIRNQLYNTRSEEFEDGAAIGRFKG